jgi:hypothetical protein
LYRVKRQYRSHRGLNYKRTPLTRPPDFATLAKNTSYRPSGAVSKRFGCHSHGSTQGGYGLAVYDWYDPYDAQQKKELLSIGQGLSRARFVTLTVEYSGVSATATFSVKYDTTTGHYLAELVLDSGTTSIDLGLGYDTGSPYMVSTLASALGLVAGVTASHGPAGVSNLVPAAFLEPVTDHDLKGSSIELQAVYWEPVNTTVTNPFSTYYGHRNDDDFENMSTVVLDNLLYLSGGGYDHVHKYDGQTLYRAGLPFPAAFSYGVGAAGAITGNNYSWRAQYIQIDHAGNVVEGNVVPDPAGSTINLAAQRATVQVANILDGTGFNTDCATVNGNQVGVNVITVNSGHTHRAGNNAYFLDRSSSTYVVREITAVGATSITVTGSPVDVNNGDAISNNLRIALYRSKTGGSAPTVWYLVDEIPNNSLAATTTYDDNKTDAQLGARLVEPATDRSAPPKGKYVSSFQGHLVVSGNIEDGRIFSWSDVDGAEYFPADSNAAYVEAEEGGVVTCIGKANEQFAVFTDKTLTLVSGDLATGNIRVEQISQDVGCKAHATYRELDGYSAWLSDKGWRYMRAGQLPKPLGEEFDDDGKSLGGRMDPVMDQRLLDDSQQLNFKRAISINDRQNREYITYIPAQSETAGGDVYSNANSLLYVYNYDRDAWLLWQGMDMTGGVVSYLGETYFIERRYSSYLVGVSHVTFRRMLKDVPESYQDDTEAIDWDYAGGWEFDGRPEAYKKWLRALIYRLDDVPGNAKLVNPSIASYEQGTLTFEQEADLVDDFQVANKDIAPADDGYGVGAYGSLPYGSPNPDSNLIKLASSKYKAVRLRMRNSEPQKNIIVSGWDLEFETPYRPKVTA